MQFNIINAIFQYEVNLIGGINIFQWEDFKEVADELIKNPQEAYVRSAMGRYYYSIFGSTRDYLVNVMNKYEFDSKKDIHKKVYDELMNSHNSNEIHLAECLKFLREIRNNADYDKSDKNEEYFKKNSQKVIKATNDAFDSLNVLINNPPYNF